MGKGNRNRETRGIEYVNVSQKQKKAPKHKKPMPAWLKKTITIAVVVVLVLGIVAAILASNGTFKRWQVLVKSKTGEFTVNRQVATFLAWELEYYYAYMSWLSSYYTDSTSDLFKTYKDPDDYAFERATASLRDDLLDSNGNVISTPRDIIDDAMTLLINHVAVSDYAYEQGIRLEKDEWKGDLTITWYSGIEDTLPVTWTELQKMQYEYGFSSMDLLLNQIFGTGMKEKDVKAAMELVCMYEKYVAMKTEAVEGATTEQNIKDYIKNNPAYFYTTDYLTYQTKDEALKAKLESVADVKGFKEVIVKNWAETEGNYKKIFNMFVVGAQAEKDYLTIEGKTGDALKSALTALGAEPAIYNKADASNAEKIHADLSKWLFDAKREAGDTVVLEAGEKYYLLAFDAKNTDSVNNTLTSVTVSQKVYEFADGETFDTDDKFKSNALAQLLIDLEISDAENIEVNYLKAIDKAENFETSCETIRTEEAQKLFEANKIGEIFRIEDGQKSDDSVPKTIRDKVFTKDLGIGDVVTVVAGSDVYFVYVEAYNEEEENLVTYSYVLVDAGEADNILADHNKALVSLMMDVLNNTATGKVVQEKDVTLTNDKIDADILAAVFDVEPAHPVGTVLTVKKSDNTVYLVCIESYNEDDDSKVTFSYTEIKADPYYQIIEEMKTELNKNVLPKESSAPYTSTPKEGSYQHWMFNGANAENGFKSPIEENAIKVISTEKTENDTKVNVYDVYIVSKPLHLDTDDLVNGGYYVYPESATKPAQDYVDSFEGLSGQALINALQKIGVSESSTSVNKATVSETIFRDDLDENLADWLFSDERKANESKVIEGKDGKTYIAVYLSKTVAWKNSGKQYYVADQVSTWIAGLASEYTVNERVLDRIGKPAPQIETSATTPAAS